jgi:hypothetical protein
LKDLRNLWGKGDPSDTSETISFLKSQMFYCPQRVWCWKSLSFISWEFKLQFKFWNKRFETFMIEFFEQNHKSSRARDRSWGTYGKCFSLRGMEWLTNGLNWVPSGQCFSANKLRLGDRTIGRWVGHCIHFYNLKASVRSLWEDSQFLLS